VLAESLLRLIGFRYSAFYQPDPTLGVRLRPGAQGNFAREGNAYVSINSRGWRDEEHALAKDPGVFRIAVLGDSFAEALQVDISRTFWKLLERSLNVSYCLNRPVEVLNFGVSGFGTAQEYLALKNFAAPFQPDLVLLAFLTGNDIRNNSYELEPEKSAPFFRSTAKGFILDTSFKDYDGFRSKQGGLWAIMRQLSDHLSVVQLLYYAKDRVQVRRPKAITWESGLDEAIYKPPAEELWGTAWSITEYAILRISQHAREIGSAFLLVTLSNPIQVHPDKEIRRRFEDRLGVTHLFYPDYRLQGFSTSHGIAVITLAPPLQKYSEQHSVFLHGFPNSDLGVGHWNEAGHEAAATMIHNHICAQRALLQPARREQEALVTYR
jgi:hypothetical protein